MSFLLIDNGNSRLKWAMASTTGELLQVCTVAIDSTLDTRWDECEAPERIWVTSVGSEQHKQRLKDIFEKKWNMTAEFITSPSSGSGITNAYKEPGRLGSDRWAAMVAAYHAVQSAVLVVDAGTALTIDAVNDQGQHLGGLILPGFDLIQNALVTGTNINFDINPGLSNSSMNSADFFGHSTEQGIASATQHALSGLIDCAFRQLGEQLLAAESADKPACYLTGGDATQIKDTLQCPYVLEPSLVLKGLALIAAAT